MKKKSRKGIHHPLKYVIWSLSVTFLFYEYFIRVTPSIILPDLMQSFHINAGQVGFLSSFYLYAYALMQIPVGSLSDKFGARRLLTVACFCCAVGSFLFGITNVLAWAATGRFLQGLGSSFGFVGLVYVSTHWFAQKRWARLIGIGNSLGMAGAVIGQGPLTYLINAWGWRPVILALAGIAFILGVVIYPIIRIDPEEMQNIEPEKKISLSEGFRIVTKNIRTWIIALASGCYYSSLLAFGALWGIPFLKNVYGFSTTSAGFAISMLYLGSIFGGPFIGYFSDRLRHRKPLLLLLTLLSFLTILPVLYIHLSVFTIFILLFLCGVFLSGQLLTYTFVIESNPIEAKATSVGFVNAMVFVISSIVQPLVGFILDRRETGPITGSTGYSPESYRWALSCFPILLLLCFFLLLCIPENQHRRKRTYTSS